MVGKMEADGDSEKEVEAETEQTSADIQIKTLGGGKNATKRKRI